MNRIQRWLATPELIGAPDCPILRRWTIFSAEKPTTSPPQGAFPLIRAPVWLTRDRKLMVHHFLPNVEDRDPHDHPRPFWTLVLRGVYVDLVPCPDCKVVNVLQPAGEPERVAYKRTASCECENALVVGDVMYAGWLARRQAKHAHVTRTGPEGAWTIIVMGPLARKWGFWRAGRWYPWKKYEEAFGFAMRCPTDEDREGLLKYSDEMVPSDSPRAH